MEGMNLKTGEIRFARKSRGGWLGTTLSVMVILVTAGVYWYLFSVQKKLSQEKASIKNEISIQEKMFLQEDFWQAYDFESRLQALNVLLKDKNSSTESLALLSQNTMAETVFRDLKISFVGEEAVFECSVTVPSYSLLARQVEAYRLMKGVSLVDFESGTVSEGGVDSVLKIFLKKASFLVEEETEESSDEEINFNPEK